MEYQQGDSGSKDREDQDLETKYEPVGSNGKSIKTHRSSRAGWEGQDALIKSSANGIGCSERIRK